MELNAEKHSRDARCRTRIGFRRSSLTGSKHRSSQPGRIRPSPITLKIQKDASLAQEKYQTVV